MAWDARTSWAFKAKIFFIDNVPLISFFKDYPIGIADYPLHIPLLETWIYNCLGVWNDQLVKVIFPLYFAGLLLIVYYGLRRIKPRLESLLFTFVLSALPFLTYHATIGYADFPLAFYYATGLLLLYLWMENKDSKFLLLSVVFLGFLPWIKKEGILLLLVSFFVFFLFLLFQRGGASFKKWGKPLIYFVIPVLISGPWFIFKKIAQISSNVDQTPYLPAWDVLAERLNSVGRIFFEKMFFSGNWNILWFLFVLVTIIYFRKILVTNAKFLFLTVVLNLASLAAIYLFTHSYKYLLDGTTLNRNILTFIPTVVLCVAVPVSFEAVRKRKKSK
jgi:4-amino-4-deoxy-L-arabinose transferase-like glycosyltransferase